MSKKVAIVKPSGLCNGGTTTLCLQYAKLGFDVYFSTYQNLNYLQPLNLDNGVSFYSNVEDLIGYLRNYDRILIVDIWIDKTSGSTALLDEVLDIHRKLPTLEICHVYAYRETKVFMEVTKYFHDNGFKFNHTFTLNCAISPESSITVMDINAMIMPELLTKSDDAPRIIFSNGRFDSYKGALRFFNSVDRTFFNDLKDFIYVHEGAVFSFHKDGIGISCPVSMISLFDTSQHPKKIRDGFSFKRYGEKPDFCTFNIYPRYSVTEAVDRWKKYYVGICFLFGTKTGRMKSSLFGKDCFVAESGEQRRILNNLAYWNTSLEYADLEKIALGIPVLFSKPYADLIGFYDDRLIYVNFCEIPKKIKTLQTCYEDARVAQYCWLVSNMKQVNSKILYEFNKDVLM